MSVLPVPLKLETSAKLPWGTFAVWKVPLTVGLLVEQSRQLPPSQLNPDAQEPLQQGSLWQPQGEGQLSELPSHVSAMSPLHCGARHCVPDGST